MRWPFFMKQELVMVYVMMVRAHLTESTAMRLVHVISLFQCIAANEETRQELIKCEIPNLLMPIVMFKSPFEVYENVRAVALSVFGIICERGGPAAIRWAFQMDILHICWFIMKFGNELSKLIALHILEFVLKDKFGISWFLSGACDPGRNNLLQTMEDLVMTMAAYNNCLPRLLFHIIRCYIFLCADSRGHAIMKVALPIPLNDPTYPSILWMRDRTVWKLLGELRQILYKDFVAAEQKPLARRWYE
ncbi:cell differentiation protein rcd1-like [Punica granatum]|uniref:Cell differentiation protein rcd1-like n=1 Tax=Punica granatum TaxID=22663 RepID=A0A6P8CWU7_PUNGR|nr:cell differentiation protein rcd1-like [Punica granatum]